MSKIEDFKWGMIVEPSKVGVERGKKCGLKELQPGNVGICLGYLGELSVRVIPKNRVTPSIYYHTFWQPLYMPPMLEQGE